jgi:CHAT domain-containing protein
VQGPRDPLSTRNEDGARLFEMLVLPAIAFIPKGSRVVVIPDGSLFGLNFETLPVESAAPHYWIDDVTVVDASSPMFISTASRTSRRARGKALLIGDPVSPSADFPPLPNAGIEISDIEKHFSSADVTLISGKNATPKAYADSQPGKFSYIHFVAHGTSSVTAPLDSAVILSRQGDSFKLYGRDIVNLPLDGALVTISACHGVGTRNYSGEGLVGLSWAFLRAGASAVVAALWEVDDASTATLMDHFYDQLSKGVAPAEALRKAKLSLLHSGTVYSKPFYWAPFQYYAGA